MTVARGIYLLVLFATLAIVVIGLRTQQVRVAAHIEQLQRERVRLRREAWVLQMEISRWRTPEQVSRRVALWSLDVRAPRPPNESVDARLAVALR